MNSAKTDGRQVHLITFGCQMNKLDSELIAQSLQAAGHSLVDSLEGAKRIRVVRQLFSEALVLAHDLPLLTKRLSEIGVQARFSTARDAVLVNVSEAVLTSNVITLSQTQPDWEQAVGRAATLVTIGERTAVDFFPERP